MIIICLFIYEFLINEFIIKNNFSYFFMITIIKYKKLF